MKRAAFLLVAVVLVGCGGPVTWKMSGPNIHGSNSLASVSAFVATNGWNMYTNEGGIFWEELDTNWVISDLPWRSLTNRQYQALTRDGIFYALTEEGWHHEYGGVAYNPQTNRFPWTVRFFKPVGGHWYVWWQPEFMSVKGVQKYE
jgi:hypothetical protein